MMKDSVVKVKVHTVAILWKSLGAIPEIIGHTRDETGFEICPQNIFTGETLLSKLFVM
jgi:hypothetical protein